ncbi:MAG: hypothetical protein ACRDHZ_26840, partial [Ktedonobacteraceae bacterium]
MILYDAHQIPAQFGCGSLAAVLTLPQIGPNTMNILQIEPEDTFAMVLTVMEQQSRPILLVLPESGAGAAFTVPEHFAQLRRFQEAGRVEDTVGFVIPANRLRSLARYAHQHNFLFSATPEKVIRSYLQRNERHQQETGESTYHEIAQSTSFPRVGQTAAIQHPLTTLFPKEEIQSEASSPITPVAS